MTKANYDDLYREVCREVIFNALSRKHLSGASQVVETPTYLALLSYRSVVACIVKASMTMYNLLGLQYCPSKTSEKHIYEFKKAYTDDFKNYYECEVEMK